MNFVQFSMVVIACMMLLSGCSKNNEPATVNQSVVNQNTDIAIAQTDGDNSNDQTDGDNSQEMPEWGPREMLGINHEFCQVVHCGAGAVECDTENILAAGYVHLDTVYKLNVIQRNGEDCVMVLNEEYCFLKKSEFDDFLKNGDYSEFSFGDVTCEGKNCIVEDTSMCSN